MTNNSLNFNIVVVFIRNFFLVDITGVRLELAGALLTRLIATSAKLVD